MNENPDIIVIGIGSILRTDDAVGVRVVEQLEIEGVPEYVRLIFGEISGLDLIKHFHHNKVILVDCAKMNTLPGTIKTFTPDDIFFSEMRGSVSTHGMDLQQTIKLAKELKEYPNIIIAGIEPWNTEFGLDLSTKMKEIIPKAAKIVRNLF